MLLPPHDGVVDGRAERGAGIRREDGVHRPGLAEGAKRPAGMLRPRRAGERAEQAHDVTGLGTHAHVPSLPACPREVK